MYTYVIVVYTPSRVHLYMEESVLLLNIQAETRRVKLWANTSEFVYEATQASNTNS